MRELALNVIEAIVSIGSVILLTVLFYLFFAPIPPAAKAQTQCTVVHSGNVDHIYCN
jgi:hypothetical protein